MCDKIVLHAFFVELKYIHLDPEQKQYNSLPVPCRHFCPPTWMTEQCPQGSPPTHPQSIEWFIEEYAVSLPSSPVSKLDRRHTWRLRKRDNLLTREVRNGWGGEKPNHTRRESLVLYKSFITRWTHRLHVFNEHQFYPHLGVKHAACFNPLITILRCGQNYPAGRGG